MDNLFKSLNDEQVRAMSANKRSKIYRKGELIFREGDHAAGLFCISRGNIKVF